MSNGGFAKRGKGTGDSTTEASSGHGPAPGKVTRTSRIPQRGAGPENGPAPVQRAPDPAAERARAERAARTRQWMNIALRPDLHPLPVQRAPGAAAAATPDAALADELGLTLTTTPAVGNGERALVGMQVTFQLDLLRPPRDLAVTITDWELSTPDGRFATRPTGPTTTLPISAPGPHVFRARIRLSDGRELVVERRFEAEPVASRARDALAGAGAVSFEEQRSQLELSRTLLGPPDAGETGQGAARRIVTGTPNPVRADAARPVPLAFALAEPERAEGPAQGRRWRWFVRPLRWDGMPATLGGHPRVRAPGGLDAYALGTGPIAWFPAAHENLYVVQCQVEDAQGRPLGEARYLQSVVGAAGERALAQIDQHIDRMDDLGGRIQGPRVPVPAVHVATRTGATTPLRLYLGRAQADPGKLVLVDLTPGLDAERNKLAYEGASATAVLDALAEDNAYPEGMISLRIGANALGIEPVARQIETDGASLLGRLSSTAGLASLLLGLGAVVTAPFTGGGSLVVLTLVVGSAAAGAGAGALSLADRLQNQELDEVGVALDVLTIATSFLNAGLAVKALRSGPAMLVASRGGRYLLWSNFAAEGLSGILVTVEAAEQITAVVQSDLDPDRKLGALVRVVSNLILTGALMGVSYGEMRSVRDRLRGPLGEVEGELSDASRMTLSLLDERTLGNLRGATAADAERLARMLRDDPGLVTRLAGRGELVPALRAARGSTATDLELAFRHVRLRARGIDGARLARLSAALRAAGLEARLVPRLGDDTLARLADSAVLGELEQVARLQRSGRVMGLEEWIRFGAAKDAKDLGRVVGELREARRQVLENPGAVVDVGGDARAPRNPARPEDPLASFDLTVERPAGKVRRSVEVTTVDKPVSQPDDIRAAIRHVTEKVVKRQAAGEPIPGRRGATIRVELHERKPLKRAGYLSVDEAGNIVQHTPNGKSIFKGNLFDNIIEYLPEVTGHQHLDRITLTDRTSGAVLAEFVRTDTVWTRMR